VPMRQKAIGDSHNTEGKYNAKFANEHNMPLAEQLDVIDQVGIHEVLLCEQVSELLFKSNDTYL
jgi:hypothetical protein